MIPGMVDCVERSVGCVVSMSAYDEAVPSFDRVLSGGAVVAATADVISRSAIQ